MYCRTARTSNGLGFPFIPVIAAGVSAAVAAFKGKGEPKVSKADAEKVVRQTYLELLEREPDAASQGYVDCLVEGWCDVDFIRTEILKSPEYRDVQTRKAVATYAPTNQSGFASTSGGALPSVSSLTSMSIGGIPLPYVVGGVLLLSLLKGRRR